VLHEQVRAGNAALDDENLDAAAHALGEVTAMTEVLGINPLSHEWASTGSEHAAQRALAALVEQLLESREQARKDRDFATADRIRDELASAGIAVEDAATGSHWRIDG
jgi:cysteinyl-tRNA synthetase